MLAKVGGLMALGATSDPSGLARTLRDPHAVADPVPTLLHDRVIQPMASDLKTILELELPIIVRLAEKPMRIDDVLDWVPGCIVDLSTDAESELDLLINNIAIGQGRAVKVGENFGIRLTFVGDLNAKLAALGRGVHELGNKSEDDEDAVSDAEASALAEQMLAGQF